MGKKKGNKQGESKQSHDQNKNEEGKKDGGGSITFVLKTDMQHCDGCATKIKRCIRGFKGFESLKIDEKDPNKLSVTGKLDPAELREKLEQRTRKKVELVSPSPTPKKDKDSGGGGGGGEKKKTEGDSKSAKKPESSDEKKPKEPPLTTAVLKMDTHCEGCIQKIHRLISKTKGYHEMSVDRQKDLVTVKGSMDMKAMAETLKEKMKRKVEIVPAKKDGGGDKKEKGGGGEGGGEGGKAAAVAVDGGGGGNKPDQNRLEYVPYPYPYPYPYPTPPVAQDYAAVPAHFPAHAPQIFSDENPNACSVM